MRPKGEKSFAQMLRIALSEAGEMEGTTRLRDVAEMCVKMALKGEIQAIKEIGDRLDGKPVAFTADVTDRIDELDADEIDAALGAIRAFRQNRKKAGKSKGAPTTH